MDWIDEMIWECHMVQVKPNGIMKIINRFILVRELPDDFTSPPSKLRKEEHKEKNSEEVHILTIGDCAKKGEQRSAADNEERANGSREDLGKETDGKLEATSESRFCRPGTAPSSLCSEPSVQNPLSPAQMVEVSHEILSCILYPLFLLC